MNFRASYLTCIISNFKSIKNTGDKTFEQLDIDDICYSPSPESNSIAIIVKHLNGNMISRWTDFLISDGEKPNRNRDNEFFNDFDNKESLLQAWEDGWSIVFSTLESLTKEDLTRKVYIRTESHLVLEAIQRQIIHYSYHIGQIVYLAKQIKDNKWQNLSIPRGMSKEFLEKKIRGNT
jgi:hypothetical protein